MKKKQKIEPQFLEILGCGSSPGVPHIGCSCKICKSKNTKNKRLRASAWLRYKGKSILIDTSTDLRQQALRSKIDKVDAVLFTHPHADHVHGIDELRSYNFLQKQTIPLFGNDWTCRELKNKFSYIFTPGPVEGGGIPQLELNQIDSKTAEINILGIPVIPISLHHGSQETLGFRIDSIAYVTDCSYIPTESIDRLKGLSVLVLDCLRLKKHGTHFNLEQSLEMIAQVKPKKAFLTHLTHDFEYASWNKKLPKGVQLAYDGLRIKLGDGS